jgi:hypothetical protein
VLAQPPRQRLRFSGGLLAVLHVDSIALHSELPQHRKIGDLWDPSPSVPVVPAAW